MQRYFVEKFEGNKVSITNDDVHHIVNVMRLKENDKMICVSNGKSAVCKLTDITDDGVTAEVVQWKDGEVELPISVTIASGLPKGDKLEWIIQKGTELGASTFIPFTASRSIVKWDEKKAAKKVERWNKISKEAAEQSHRTHQPRVREPISLKQLIHEHVDTDHKLIAFEEDAKEGEHALLHTTLKSMETGQSLIIVFGPEGGLTLDEVALLKENGFVSCGLGPRILRTETAPLYALAAISYHIELMR